MTPGARTIRVRTSARPATSVCWFPGSSSESIEWACKVALDLPADATIRVTDPLNCCTVALTEWIPEGLELEVDVVDDKKNSEPRESSDERRRLLEGSRGDDAQPAQPRLPEEAFRGQLLKFERINAHLANERTWLAWVRTALSLVSCA